VTRQLLEVLADESIGVASPALVTRGANGFATARPSRVGFVGVTFGYEWTGDSQAEVLEADYCELEFALFRAALFGDIGRFDPHFSSHVAAAEFGLRLRQRGYSRRQLPAGTGSCALATERGRSRSTLARAPPPARFATSAGRHLRHGINYQRKPQASNSSWSVVDQTFRQLPGGTA